MSVATALATVAEIRRLPVGRWLLRRDELVERLDLGAALHRQLGHLTPGERVRAELAAALLHEPALLVLDDVTAGLDVTSRERVRLFLRQEHRSHRRTMLVTARTHGDLAPLCQRVLVLDDGRLSFDGSLAELAERNGIRRVLVIDLARPGKPLEGLPGAELLDVEDGGLRQRLELRPGATDPAQLLREVNARAEVRDAVLLEPDPEDVVRRLGASC
jgi:ABC-2 type transport system ATP-binding protein